MYKLAYLSVANSTYQNKKNLQSLVEDSLKNNQQHQVTSNLVYSEGHFFHILEGEESTVTETFLKIRNNISHRILQLITPQEQGEGQLFPDWPLAFSTLSRASKFSKPENHFLNFSQVIKNNTLTSYSQIHEAFFTPLKNGTDRFYQDKIVIISDSHVKSATFMNWIADTVKSKISRVEFEDQHSSHNLIDYLDFKHDGRPVRIIGFEIGALANPAMIPQLMHANRILLLISGNTTSVAEILRQLPDPHLQAIKKTQRIECFFAKSAQNQSEQINDALSALEISVKHSDLQPNDFAGIWLNMRKSLEKNSTIASPGVIGHAQDVLAVDAVPEVEVSVIPEVETPIKPELKTVSKEKVNTKQDVSNSKPSTSTTIFTNNTGVTTVANIKDSLAELMKIDGAMGCFIADYTSGMMLAKEGGGIDLELAAAGNTEVIRAKMKVMSMLGIKDTIEDMLITLGTQFHIIRPSSTKTGLFLYIVLDKTKSNLAMARFKLTEVEKSLEI